MRALETAATEAARALAELANEAEAEGDQQAAHYARHRVDALEQALAKARARVVIICEDDEAASRVVSLLEALNYEVSRAG